MTRPRKIIIVYSEYPDQAATWAFKIGLQPAFRAITVTTPAQLAHQYGPDAGVIPAGLLLCVDRIDHAEGLLRLIPVGTQGVVVSVVAEILHLPEWNTGHLYRLTGPSAEDVFYALKAATARKRGPLKGRRRPTPDTQLAPAEAAL